MKARTNGVILNKKDRTNKKNARIVAVEKALSEIITIVNDKLFVFQLSDVMKCCSKTCLPNLSIGSLIILFGKIFMRNLINTTAIQRIVQDTNQQISFDEMTEILTRLKNKIVENWCVVEPSLIVARESSVQVPNNYRY